MDDNNLDQTSDNQQPISQPITNTTNEGVIHSAVGDIHVPESNSKIPFDMNFTFNPTTPITLSSDQGYGQSTTEEGIQQPSPGFFKTTAAEAYEFNSTLQAAHYSYSQFNEDLTLPEVTPDGWTPNSQPEMFYDVQPQYNSYLMDSRGPKDLQYRRDRVLSEQEHDNTLANGSMFARIIGGIAGVASDPVSYIPIAGWVKYAKFAPTILKTAARTFPGLAAAGVIQAGAQQLDKVNGNLHDFIIDSAVNTVAATAIFGGFSGVSLALDKMEMWNLKDILSSHIKGIDFNHEMNDKGEITGIKAIDTTGNLSAANVTYAQDLANSSFAKTGFFKIPYIGNAALSLKGYPGIGSPLLNMLNSPYQTIRGFIDRAADHSIITQGIAQGGVRPKSFEFLMKRTFSSLRSISAQMNALHLQRMGIDLSSRPIADATQIGLGLYNKSLKLLGQDLDKTGYISRDEFDDEVQHVLTTKETSKHAAVNDAASMMREHIDGAFDAYRKAYNLPEGYIDHATAAGYLMRVYDIPYMNTNKDKWVSAISNWLKDSDATITERMQPINDIKDRIQKSQEAHEQLVRGTNKTDQQVKDSVDNINALKLRKKSLEENLQNELRTNADLNLHIDDRTALSADEAKELNELTKRRDIAAKEIDEQKKYIADMKQKMSKAKSSAMKAKTVSTGKKKIRQSDIGELALQPELEKLRALEKEHDDEIENIQGKIESGQVNPRLYYKEQGSARYTLRDPNNRLKFRDVYESQFHREQHAKSYYDSIMHLKPEDIISDVMGKVNGSVSENPLKSRTLLVPDKLLYDNNFMTKNLMSKVSNYSLYLARRTHLKNVFKDVTIDGGIEPLIENLSKEYQSKRLPWDSRKADINQKIDKINEQLKSESLSDLQKNNLTTSFSDLQNESTKLDKNLKDEGKRFESAKKQMNKAYEKMMGLSGRSQGENLARSVIMSMTAMTNLHFLPATQIADLGSIGLQHGVWPFIRDAVYPAIQSLGGLLKTQDSEALRKSAPSVHLALQDVLGGYGDKNWSMEAQPYLNLGRIVGGIEKLAHFSSNTDLTTYIDNGLQRLAGATVQSEFMRILHSSVEGSLTKKDSEYLRKYGIDPKVWDKRMVDAYKEAKGFKTALGGYQSNFWVWQDMEAANEFSDAVFRGIQNTIINKGMFDSPFWADNILGMLFHTFTGWGYASINRYLVPMLQRPDASQLLGVTLSLGMGALVSPLRRLIRGENAVPDNMTDGQRFWESINDSNVGSAIATTLDWANLLSGDRLLGDLKNDKYQNRMRIGAFGPIIGTANRLGNIFDSLASGEFNQNDADEMARMLPVTGSVWGYHMSKMLIDKLGLPANRQAAAAQ